MSKYYGASRAAGVPRRADGMVGAGVVGRVRLAGCGPVGASEGEAAGVSATGGCLT